MRPTPSAVQYMKTMLLVAPCTGRTFSAAGCRAGEPGPIADAMPNVPFEFEASYRGMCGS